MYARKMDCCTLENASERETLKMCGVDKNHGGVALAW